MAGVVFGFGFSSSFGVFSIIPPTRQQSTSGQTVFQNSHQDSNVISHAQSVKLAVDVLIRQTSFYFSLKNQNKQTNNLGKSQATQTDILHGNKKIKTKWKITHHQSSFNYDLKSLLIFNDTQRTDKNQNETKPPQLSELALLNRGIIGSPKAVTVILTGKMFSRTWI